MRERLSPVEFQLARSRRLELREELAKIPELLEQDPQKWVPSFVREIVQLKRNVGAFPIQTQEYLNLALDSAMQAIRQEQAYTRDNPSDPLLSPVLEDVKSLSEDEQKDWTGKFEYMRGVRADQMLMNFSRIMAEPFGKELTPVQETIVPIEEIIAKNPGQSRLAIEEVDSKLIKVAYFKHPFKDIWQRIPLPFDKSTALKGGSARIINGFYAGAPDSMKAAEIPQNDTDIVIAVPDEGGEKLADSWAVADILGADHAGVEFKCGNELNYQDYANSRDMTINMSWVAIDGLHTCPEAVESARSGIVDITGNYRPDKAIYNTDRFTYNDRQTNESVIIPKQRGISRLVKATAEGKIIGFNYMDISANTPLNIYSLWLVKRWFKYIDPNSQQYNPQQFGELLDRTFHLAKDMGHVPSGIDNVIDYLDAIHTDFPYFDFRKDIKGIVDTVRWKGKRLAKQLDREYSWTTGVPGDYEFIRREGDTSVRLVTLNEYTPDQPSIDHILEQFPDFMKRSEQRSDNYLKLNLKPSQKYFFLDMDLETAPSSE